MTREELTPALEWADKRKKRKDAASMFSKRYPHLEHPAALASALREAWAEIDRLRKSIWLNHGCSIRDLYGDDGEMQCSRCGVDFKRDSVDLITACFVVERPGYNRSLDEALNSGDGSYKP